jgi:putative addiction module component (TIGR02574 family)
MNATEILTRIRQLPAADRLDLAKRLWEEMCQDPGIAPLTRSERDLLDERARAHDQDPDAALSWEHVRDETLEDL